jgi:hypothetical protein
MCDPNFKFHIIEKWTLMGKLLPNQSQVHITANNPPKRGQNGVSWQIVLEISIKQNVGSRNNNHWHKLWEGQIMFVFKKNLFFLQRSLMVF